MSGTIGAKQRGIEMKRLAEAAVFCFILAFLAASPAAAQEQLIGARYPALSPDGTRAAFVWAGPDGENADVYLKQRDSETVLRLTDEPGWAAWPAWS